MLSRGSQQQKGHCGTKERAGAARHALGSLLVWPLSVVMEPHREVRLFLSPGCELQNFCLGQSISALSTTTAWLSSLWFSRMTAVSHSAVRFISSSTQDTPMSREQAGSCSISGALLLLGTSLLDPKSQLQALPQDYGSREGLCILGDLSAEGGKKIDNFFKKNHPKNPLSISVTMTHNRNKNWDQLTLSQEINLHLCELPEVLERLQKVWRGNSKKHTQETLTWCH